MNPEFFTFPCLVVVLILGWIVHMSLRKVPGCFGVPELTMILSSVGMVAGLLFDTRHGDWVLLTSFCGARLPLLQSVQWHFRELPGSNIGMLIGGLSPLIWSPGLRSLRTSSRMPGMVSGVCYFAAMSGGMNLGMPLAELLGPRAGASAGWMLTAMVAGMIWGMVWIDSLAWIFHEGRRWLRLVWSAPKVTSGRGF